MTTNLICVNCETAISGKYCSECGQKAHTHRLSLHDLAHELWHALTHADKGVLKLLKDLFLHPSGAYFGYFKGERKKYFSPVLFFLLSAGLVAYFYPFVFDYEDKVRHMNNEFGRETYHLVKYRALILLPVQALIYWAFFHKRYNIAEITVFWLFCLGFTFAIRLIFIPVYFPFIWHKADIDNLIIIISYLVMWIHSGIVFARAKVYNYVLLFLLVNVFLIFDGLIIRAIVTYHFHRNLMPALNELPQFIKSIYTW